MNNDLLIPPSELAVQTFGGVRATARLLGCDASAVSRWKKAGLIPSHWQKPILEMAWQRGLDLTAHDLIFGRETA